jgi:hypothetical protein
MAAIEQKRGQRKKILPDDEASPSRVEKKSQQLSPKILPDCGSVERRFVRCGRVNCKCAKGELHGPYTYVRTYRGGKRWRKYVKNDDVSALFQARKRRQEWIKEMKQAQDEFRQQWRELKSLLRSVGL